MGLIVVGLLVGSCELEPEIFSSISPENFPKTEADINAAVTDIYRDMGEAWSPRFIDNSHWILNIMPTDVLRSAWGGQWQTIDRLSWTASTGTFWRNYELYVKSITKATLLIGQLENTTLDDEDAKARSIAEIRALRAYFAFNLLDLFGPVPIIVDYEEALNISSDTKPERPTTQWMVDFISSELTAAAATLPEAYGGSDYGRITKGAALTTLMKLQLHQKDWAGVLSTTNQIMSLGYSLMPSYPGVFDVANEGNANSEVILAIPKVAGTGISTSWYAAVLPQTPRYKPLTGITVSIWGGLKTPWWFYDKFEEGVDERLTRLIRHYEAEDGTMVDFRQETNNKAIGAAPKKYGEDPGHDGHQQGNDIIIYRYADVLLARAEALNETSALSAEAQSLVQEVRDRAQAGAIPASALTSQSDFRDFILDERGRELWTEGVRRQDLIRHGKFISTAIDDGFTAVQDHLVLYPIPQRALDENENIVQNPGYTGG